MSLGLGQHTVAGVVQDHGQGQPSMHSGHVASVLFVAWCVSDDELALGGRKIAIRNVDRNALFTFGLQTIGDQSGIEFTAVVPCVTDSLSSCASWSS